MLKKISLIKFLTMSVLVFTLFTVLILVGFEIFTEIRSFRRNSNAIRKEYTASQKEIIKSQVEDVVQLVQEGKKNLEAEVKKQLSLETENIYSIAEFIYHQDLVNKKDVVLSALSRLMENLNDIDLCILDNSDQPVVKYTKNGASYFNDKTFIEFISQKNEGFHTFHFPNKNDTTERFLQITRFEPFNWIFCVATDKSEQEKKLQKNLLSRIGKIRYGPADVGYIFVVSYDGVTLMNDTQRHLVGKNIWEFTDPNGIKVIQEERKAVKNPLGDFIEYSWRKPGTNVILPKISFMKGIPEWKWMIGAGAYLEDIDRYIVEREKILRGNLVRFGSIFLFFMICFVVFISYGFSRLNRRVSSDLNLLIDFLKTAVKEQQPIDRKKIKFSEFDEISAFANEMLSEKMALLQELNSEKEKLEDSEKKYYSLFINAPLSYQSLDEKGYILDVNPRWLTTLGYSREEVIGKWFGDFLDPDYAPHFEKNFPRFKAAGCISGVQFKMRRKNDSLLYVEFEGCVGYHSDGSFKQTYCVFKDITQAKQAEEALKQKTEQFELAVKGSNDGIWDWNILTNYLYLSPRWKELLGYKDSEIPNDYSSFKLNIYGEDQERVLQEIDDYLSKKIDIFDIEFRMIHKNGSNRWFRARGEALWNEKGIPYRMAGSHTDITLRKKMENDLQGREKRFNDMLKCIPDLVSVHDKEMNILYSNWNGYGSVPEEKRRIGSKCYKTYFDQDVVCSNCHSIKVFETGQSERKEIQLSDGTWVDLRIIPLLDDKDEIYAFMEWIRDISDRKRKEIQLQKSEKKYRELFDNLPLGIAQTKADGKIIAVNRTMAKIYGFNSTDELMKNTAYKFYKYSKDRDRMKKFLLEKGELKNFISTGIKKNGEEVIVSTHYRGTFDENGQLLYIDGITEDITEKVAKEKQINKLSTAVEQSPSVVVITDLEGNVEYVNPKFTEVTGYTFSEMVGKNPRILKSGELSNKVYDELWQTLENNQTWRGEFHNRKKNGDLFWESAAISPIFNNSGEKINYIKMSEDTTLQKEMEISLKLNEEKYRNIFQNAPVGIFQFSKSGIVKDCNDRFVEIMDSSRPLIIGINMFKSLKNNDLIQLLKKSFRTGYGKDEGWYEPISGSRKIYGKVQFKIIKNDSGEFVTGFGMVENLTHQKRLEEMRQSMEKQKQTSQRLETIGTLAGGIAHDFNNILTPILGYSGMIKKSISEKDKIYEEIDEIYHAGLRARDLISQILNFSRQRETQKTPLYPHLILNEAIKLMRPTIPSMIEMKLSIDKSCGQVLMDGSKIHQVIINLCTNAAQAMKDRAGVLKISLKEVKAREDQNLRLERQKAENYCKMSFSDTGVGISETVKDRIFDPFFTTKEVGEGTGLGLSVVHGIIKEHDGFVFVKSEVNKGSCFDIYLPVAEQPGNKEQDEEHSDEITGSNESVLLVDDRADVTKMLISLLKEFGYNVTAFNDSEEGYKYFAENKDIIDLVISDYAMPKMSGLELAERIRKVRNNIPILFITGNSSKLSMEKLSKLDNKRVLNKPILTYEFSIAVHELLEKNKRSHT